MFCYHRRLRRSAERSRARYEAKRQSFAVHPRPKLCECRDCGATVEVETMEP